MNTTSKRNLWAGRILTGMVTLVLVGSAIAKLAHLPRMVDGLTRAGIPQAAMLPIAALELTCLTVYLISRTKVLGALLLTGYFGGAVVTHIIGGGSVLPPIMVGFWVRGGAYFRVPELRNLLPLRKVISGGFVEAARQQQRREAA